MSNMLKYDIQYDIATIIAMLFMAIIYFVRRNYSTKSNVCLGIMILCNTMAAAFDIMSCYTISFPERYNSFYCHFTALGYLFFYNCMGILFFAYIDSKAKVVRFWKSNKILIGLVTAFTAFILFTSPWTHMIAWFDENNVYHHGPWMIYLYAQAALLLLGAVVLYILGRQRFNRYQFFAMCAFVLVVVVGVLIQMVFPRFLVGDFACGLVLFFIYTAFENPAYYTYKTTRCYNRDTFRLTLKRRSRNKDKFSFVCFSIKDYLFLKHGLKIKDADRLTTSIAGFLYVNFKTNAYVLSEDKYIVILDGLDKDLVLEKLDEFFGEPIQLVTISTSVFINTKCVENVSLEDGADAIEEGINYLLDNTDQESESIHDFERIIKANMRKQSILHVLDEAVREKKFKVVYQPIRNVNTGKFTCAEALVRLIDDSLGFISPEEFIPIAEANGYVCEIGEIVYEQVCQFISSNKLTEKGMDYVEINLSPLQCVQLDLVVRFKAIMEKYNVKPSWINLEITETARLQKDGIMEQNIADLHEMGISFSLDDYGSGFASQDYLFKLPVEIVKIDKGILWQAMKDENAMIILTHTMKMLKDLDKHIVVEGVEDEAMIRVLEANGCDYMQGYYYSKPIPGNDLVEYIDSNNA